MVNTRCQIPISTPRPLTVACVSLLPAPRAELPPTCTVGSGSLLFRDWVGGGKEETQASLSLPLGTVWKPGPFSKVTI